MIDYTVEYEPSFEVFREICQRVTTYYTIDRYPFFVRSEVSEKEIREGLKKAKELKNKILGGKGVKPRH